MPKISSIFVPREVDFKKPSSAKDKQGFEKSHKYQGQVLKDDPKHREGGHYRTLGGVLTYSGKLQSGQSKGFFANIFSKKQPSTKERFVQPAPMQDYFTYYCYEIYQYCGVNTPKYRYGKEITSKTQEYDYTAGKTKEVEVAGFAHVSTLIPQGKIPLRDVGFTGKAYGYGQTSAQDKLTLLGDQHLMSTSSSSSSPAVPEKISGNFFGGHLVGLLLQNHDMGGLNGYFVEYQNRQHYFVIDMNKTSFKEEEHYQQRRYEFSKTDGRAFDHLATDDQRLAVISKIDSLLKGDLEKIYYSPRAIEMYFELQPQLAMKFIDKVVSASYRPAVMSEQTAFDAAAKPILDEFERKVAAMTQLAPHTKEGVEKLCRDIRELAATYKNKFADLPNANKVNKQYNIDPHASFDQYLNNQITFFPDLQIKEIRKNGQELINHYAPGNTLNEFHQREKERNVIADEVMKQLNIDPPENETVKQYIIEDLRGQYYEQSNRKALVEKLVADFKTELTANVSNKNQQKL